jgi:hypothetical protein
MKKIIIKDDEYNFKYSAEIDSDSNIEDLMDSIKGLLLSCGYSYECVKNYFEQ